MSETGEQVVLCVIAGLGVAEEAEDNAWTAAETPVLDRLWAEQPKCTLAAAGKAVGLPGGSVGTGDAGFRTLGAGRPARAAWRAVDDALRKGRFSLNPAIDQTLRAAMFDDNRLHLFALLTEADVHGSLEHVYAIAEAADFNEVSLVVHGIVDGRDVPRKSASAYLEQLETFLESKPKATLGTISGRAYAMDRDGRWDRTFKAFQAIVRDASNQAPARTSPTAFEALREAYLTDADDEWMPPTRIGDYTGLRGDLTRDFAEAGSPWEWLGDESGLLCVARPDRVAQLAAMLTSRGIPDDVRTELLTDRGRPVRAFREGYFATLTRVHDDILYAFDADSLDDGLCATLAKAGVKALLCGESEGKAHLDVFRAGHDTELSVVPSTPLADRWTDKPAMRSKKIAKAAAEAIRGGEHRFVLVELVAPDAVAHSGELEPTLEALAATDAALGEVLAAAEERGATVLVTSSHGHCEQMFTDQGHPFTGHTDHPVPFVVVGRDGELREDGSLADVAPTVLAALGVEVPAAMTGRPLWRDDRDDEST